MVLVALYEYLTKVNLCTQGVGMSQSNKGGWIKKNWSAFSNLVSSEPSFDIYMYVYVYKIITFKFKVFYCIYFSIRIL